MPILVDHDELEKAWQEASEIVNSKIVPGELLIFKRTRWYGDEGEEEYGVYLVKSLVPSDRGLVADIQLLSSNVGREPNISTLYLVWQDNPWVGVPKPVNNSRHWRHQR